MEDSTWRSKAERAVARRNGEFIRYVWRKDGKGQDKADDGSLLWRPGRCALRDDLTGMTVPQLQGCYRALRGAAGVKQQNCPGKAADVRAACPNP